MFTKRRRLTETRADYGPSPRPFGSLSETSTAPLTSAPSSHEGSESAVSPPWSSGTGPDVNSARTSQTRRSSQLTSKAERDEEKSFLMKTRATQRGFRDKRLDFCAFGISRFSDSE